MNQVHRSPIEDDDLDGYAEQAFEFSLEPLGQGPQATLGSRLEEDAHVDVASWSRLVPSDAAKEVDRDYFGGRPSEERNEAFLYGSAVHAVEVTSMASLA